jgi:hypothetical protein
MSSVYWFFEVLRTAGEFEKATKWVMQGEIRESFRGARGALSGPLSSHSPAPD